MSASDLLEFDWEDIARAAREFADELIRAGAVYADVTHDAEGLVDSEHCECEPHIAFVGEIGPRAPVERMVERILAIHDRAQQRIARARIEKYLQNSLDRKSAQA